jgi:hypothetical protein
MHQESALFQKGQQTAPQQSAHILFQQASACAAAAFVMMHKQVTSFKQAFSSWIATIATENCDLKTRVADAQVNPAASFLKQPIAKATFAVAGSRP